MPVLSAGTGLHETLALLTSQLRPDANHKEDLGFLKDVFSEKSLTYLMKIHEKLQQYERQSPTPILHTAHSLAEDAVLTVHDTVAQKNFDPVLPPLPEDFEDELEEESVKIVRLVKNKEPLPQAYIAFSGVTALLLGGCMVSPQCEKKRSADGTRFGGQHVFIFTLPSQHRGGSGLVHVGDEFREVNGILIVHKRPDEISQILSQSQGSITLKIIPAIKEEDRLKESKVHMRALFDYIPAEDKATPCQEAGLPFKKGDILQVVSQDDPTWWQAKRVGDSNLRAGLIPSKQFQERTSLQGSLVHIEPRTPWLTRFTHPEDCDCESYFNGQYIAGLRRSFRLSRKERQNTQNEAKQAEPSEPELLTYEEVTRYQQRPNERPRLVLLIGSLGARINELKQKVIAENPQHYGVAVPHTTRSKKSHEKEGVEYHFVSKQTFEADTQNNKFVEYGDYKENQYGMSLQAIRSVLSKNKMCLVDVQPEAIKSLRTAEFKPYVIFVKPRVPEGHRRRSAATSPGTGEHVRSVDEEYQEMRQSAALIEKQYGHLVDKVLVKDNSQSACSELKNILERLEREPFWVPCSWVRT
ncbi:UNVERIFIED_CONTAM: hypothetical protein FKN15_028298 [Acipenser sinensis]